MRNDVLFNRTWISRTVGLERWEAQNRTTYQRSGVGSPRLREWRNKTSDNILISKKGLRGGASKK